MRNLMFLLIPLLLGATAPQVLDHPVVISLQRHNYRYLQTKERMESAGFTNIQRFEGVDGYLTPNSEFERLNIYGGKGVTPGSKGCTASHLLVWEKFLQESDQEYLFIAEDDMVPHSDFQTLFPKFWEKTPKEFDLVLVGNQMPTSALDPLIISCPSFCLHAYIISKEGARKLVNLFRTKKKHDHEDVMDIFLINLMIRGLVRYYCYNGRSFPDLINYKTRNICQTKDSGICFQDPALGTVSQSFDVKYEPGY